MVNELDFEYVLNIDKDEETLERMRRRWEDGNEHENSNSHSQQQQKNKHTCLEYKVVDFCCALPGADELPHSPYPLIVEKSTLDCTLCSADASTGLLSLVYQHLAVGGYYVLISFNSLELLLPLLRDLPGATWTVSHQKMTRQVEDVSRHGIAIGSSSNSSSQKSTIPDNIPIESSSPHAWCAGNCESQVPDTDLSTRILNVLICHKTCDLSQDQYTTTTTMLDWDAVQHHIVTTNNIWYQTLHPLLTETRRREIEQHFGATVVGGDPDDDDDNDNTLFVSSSFRSLLECYQILFSDAERQDLTYDYFLEDWHAYVDNHPNVPTTEMTLTTALDFLQEMQ